MFLRNLMVLIMYKSNFISRYVFACTISILFLQISSVFATHNVSKYFPFLERPEEYIIKRKSHFSPSLFFTMASVSFRRGGGNAGIPELWGYYDLKDVIGSLEHVKGSSFTNPIETERGPNDSWINQSIRFKVDGKIKGEGIILNYEQQLWKYFSCGAFIPIMHINTSDYFTFLPNNSSTVVESLRDGELLQLDRIRRMVHDDLDVNGGDWSKTGFGDLDLHFRFNYHWDHRLLMRSIDLNLQIGLLVPTGVKYDIDYPTAVSFMGNGFWGCYFDFVTECELKQDWKVGLILGFVHQFDKSRTIRIPVYKEPAIFSDLKANVEIDPGMTFKISPYIEIDNISDGLNFQARYTYLRHSKDSWKDKRENPQITSYLNLAVGDTISGDVLTSENISENISNKENLTLWRDQYFTLQLAYDTKEAGNNWIFDPIIYALFDYQAQGNGSCKTHQFTLGIELHF